jgi:hypothetical protein
MLLILSNNIFSAENSKTIFSSKFLLEKKGIVDPSGITNSKLFDFSNSNFNQISKFNEIKIKNFPVSTTKNTDISFTKTRNIFDQNTKFLTESKSGEIVVSAPTCEIFKGVADNNPNIKLTLIYVNESFFCSIDNSNEKFIICSNDNKNDELILVNEKEFFKNQNFNFECKNENIKPVIDKKIEDRIQSNNLLELEVAVETDTEFFKAAGSTLQKAQAYAIALFVMVNSIYEKELNITLYIPWLKCWTDSPADPYSSKGDPFALRDKAGPYWKANHTDVQRDIFHVLTSISYGGGGYGYLNALCGNKDYGFASSSIQGQHNYPTFTFNYDVYIVAHELGHNLNGQHTHSCYWGYPLDTCLVDDGKAVGCLSASEQPKPNPGSIMSYCGGTNSSAGLGYQVNMTFLPQNQFLMRSTAEAATCVTEPVSPKVVILSPNGNESFEAKTPIEIKFNSARIDNLNLNYSIDNGKSWKIIAENIKATDGKFSWIAPDICTNNCKIIISSTSDSKVADTTILPISIYQNKPTDLMGKYYFDSEIINEICGGLADPLLNYTGITKTTDRFGLKDSALAFDGTGYLMIPAADLTKSSLSVSLWVNASDLSDKKFFIGTNYGPALNVFEIYYWGLIGCTYYLNSGFWQVWGSGANINTWYHIVFSYDGNTADVYINGSLVKSEKKSAKLIPFKTPIYIGSRKGSEPFKGKIDDIRIYTKALTALEVQEIYTDKRAPQSPTLLLPKDNYSSNYWKIDFSWKYEDNPYSYNLQIAKDNSFSKSSMIFDSTLTDTSYNYVEHLNVGDYYWRIKAINAFGASQWTTRSFHISPLDVEDNIQNKYLILFQSEPNPATNKVHIRYDLNESANCEMLIFNNQNEIMNFKLGNLDSGTHSIDIDFSKFPSGIYFYSLKTNFGTSTKKLEIIK